MLYFLDQKTIRPYHFLGESYAGSKSFKFFMVLWRFFKKFDQLQAVASVSPLCNFAKRFVKWNCHGLPKLLSCYFMSQKYHYHSASWYFNQEKWCLFLRSSVIAKLWSKADTILNIVEMVEWLVLKLKLKKR